ncbi:MAG TPA: methyltransferase domain-containing protein [Bacteroidota bacterium]
MATALHSGPGDPVPGELARTYDLVAHSVPVAGRTFRLLAVRDTNRLVDGIDPKTFAADERLPYWAELWTASIALAEWCLGTRWEPAARVLELGCGLGLAGIAAAAAGAHVTMTDYDDDALRFARCNAGANLPPDVVRDHLRFAHLDWRNPPLDTTYDVILGADIVYERRFFLPLLTLFDRLLNPSHSRSSTGPLRSVGRDMCPDLGRQGGCVVLTEPDRSVGKEFFHGAKLAGFDVTTQNSVVYWQGRAAGIVRAELRRGGR